MTFLSSLLLIGFPFILPAIRVLVDFDQPDVYFGQDEMSRPSFPSPA